MTRPHKRNGRYTPPERHRVSKSLVGRSFPVVPSEPVTLDELGLPAGAGPVVYRDGEPHVFDEFEAAWIAEHSGMDAQTVEVILANRSMVEVAGDGDMVVCLHPGHEVQAAIAGVDIQVARDVTEWHHRFLAAHDLAHRDADGEWVAADVIRFSNPDLRLTGPELLELLEHLGERP